MMKAELNNWGNLSQKAQNIWEMLGNIPTNENDEIETDFLHFEKGTNREEIWLWYENKYNIIVGNIL